MVALCRVPTFTSPSAQGSDSVDLVTQIARRQLKQYRVVAVDLDGTLLNSKGQISNSQIKYLRELYYRGIVIVLCTGRALTAIFDQLVRLNIPDSIPVVCSNGSTGVLCRVKEPQRNRKVIAQDVVFDQPVKMRIAMKTIELANEYGFTMLYYQGDMVYANPKTSQHYQLTTAYKKLTGNDVVLVGDDFLSLLRQPNLLPSRLHVLGVENAAVFSNRLGKEANVMTKQSRTLGQILQVMDPDVNKGLGLKKLCEVMNLDLSLCIAIGDGDNDLELLQMAGLGLALSNSGIRAKAASDVVMKWSNDQDGVMKTLQLLEREGLLWAD